MNRRFVIAWVVLFVVWFFGSFLVHGFLIGSDYKALQGTLFRTEQDSQQYFPWMIVAHVLLSGAFVWIYAKGVESRDWLPQGIRYGIAISLLTIVPTYLIYFVVQPTPLPMVIKQIAYDGVLMIVLGVVVAFLYRDAGRPAV